MFEDPTPPRRLRLWEAWSPMRLGAFALMLLIANMFWQAAIHGLTGDIFVPVILAALVAVVLPCAMVARWHGETLASAFEMRFAWVAAAAGGLAGLLALAPASWLASFSSRLRPPSADYLAFLAEHLPGDLTGAVVALIAVSVAAPVAEELIFRSLCFRLARDRWGAGRAAVLSALFFGIMHWQPWSLFGLVGLGLLLAALYHWTGTLWAPIAAHATHNAVSLTLLIRAREDLDGGEPATIGTLDSAGGLALVLISAALLAGLLRWLRRPGG